MPRRYVPDRGDVVWLQFNPQAGHEQSGRRPAFVLSPAAYNTKVGLALFCPVTSKVKGYPFEVIIPAGLEVKGAILSDQIRNMDWRARQVTLISRAPDLLVNEVLARIYAILEYDE